MNARIASILFAAAAIPCAATAGDAVPASGPSMIIAAASSASAAPQGCPGDAGLSMLQRRILAKYDQDLRYMLQFVWTVRAVYQLDRAETAQWAEAYRMTHPAC